jgi:hypothetical protein
MPLDNTDYSNTVFYKIYCNDTTVNDIYVGHTTNFEKRKYAHNRACIKANNPNHHLKVYKFIREHGGWVNWKMDMIGFRDCNDLNEARKVEQTYFETLHATLNSIEPLPKPKVRPTTTPKEKREVTGKFNCAKCNYICNKCSDYNKHLLTAKHKRQAIANQNSKEVAKSYSCECNKTYSHLSSLWKHKKKCGLIMKNDETVGNNVVSIDSVDYKSLFLKSIERNNELMNVIALQAEKYNEIMTKLNVVIPIIGTNMKNNECSPK